MKILVVSSFLPFPLHSGGQVRLYNLIKELSEKHEITLVSEIRPHQNQDDIAAVEKICHKVITVQRKKQWSLGNVLGAATSSHSFLVTGHTLPMMRVVIQQELDAERYDLIHVETYYVAQNIPPTQIPIVLVEHNIEYQIYEKFSSRLPKPARPLLNLDIKKIRSEEEQLWKRVKTTVAVSEEDRSVMEKAGAKAGLVPNGVNTEEFTFLPLEKRRNNTKKILFIGDYKWIQNQDAIRFILNDIWPITRGMGKGESVKLWIVGRSIPDWVRKLTNDPDVLFDEKSSSKPTPEIFQEAYALLAPIRVGGGTSYKILEAMSCGTPVVTMPMSANAIHAEDGKHILVGENAKEIAGKTIEVLQNSDRYETISSNGRKLIESKFTWKEISKELDSIYHQTTK